MSAAPTFSRPFGCRPPAVAQDGAIVLRRGTMYAAGSALGLLAFWAAGSAWYLLNHDRLAAHLLAKQTEMQYAYEDRIGALRSRLDQVASQKLMAQESLDARVAGLAARQAVLETRQNMMATLVEQAGLGLAASAARLPSAAPSPELPGGVSAYLPTPKPTPVPEALGLRLREPSPVQEPAANQAAGGKPLEQSSLPIQDRIGALQKALARVEADQLRALDGLARRSERRLGQWRSAINEVGLNPDRLEGPPAKDGVGGPLVPLPAGRPTGPFEAALSEAQKAIAELDRLRRTGAALPFGRPTSGEADLTSGYGVRLDPFTRSPALHTGLDFRADHGSAVRAAGAGEVAAAEHAGGYGKMVEIEHAGGVTTRYAHLSSLAVVPGQKVSAGDVIGRVGSTGRSTGPHLHYEVRIDGAPVDPQRFLRAGVRLAEAGAAP